MKFFVPAVRQATVQVSTARPAVCVFYERVAGIRKKFDFIQSNQWLARPQTIPLTASVDAINGTAGNDTISGVIGSSGTYSVGDNIMGGSGNDTLNLIATTGGATEVVSIDGVENINIRLLDAAVTTDVNAADWSGVAVLSNASSVADSTLRVSGLTLGTQIKVHGQTFVNVDFAGLTTATDTASLVLVQAGSGGGTAASLATANTADVTLDTTGADLLDAINVEVQGANYARIEGGDGLRSITVRGTGTAVINTDDLITSFDASALTGTNRFTFSGRSDVAVVGGAGNDTFVFGTSLNSFDTINGGSGTDTISATIGASTVRVSATAVEAMTITLGEVAAGMVDVSGVASLQAVTVGATGGASGSLTNFAGATVNLSDDDLTDFSIDTVGGSLTVVVGSASGAVGVATATITDAVAVTVVGSGSSTESTINELSISNTAKTVNLGASGSGSLDITTVKASGAEDITLTAGGSASLTIRSDFGATGLKTITVNATDSNAADILITGSTLFDVAATAAKLDTVTLNASSGADIVIAGMQLGTSTYSASGTLNNAVTITLNAGKDSDIAGSAAAVSGIDILGTATTLTINANAGGSGDILLQEIDMGDEGAASATGVMSLNINVGTIGTGGTVNVAGISGSGLPVTIGAATVGQSASFILGSAGLSLSGGTASFGAITVQQSGYFAIGTTGAAGISGGEVGLTSGGAKVTGLDVTVGTAGEFVLAAASGTQFGAISINLQGASAEARTHTLDVNDTGTGGTIGAINILASGAGASADIGGMSASAIGAISVTTDGSANVVFASFSGSATVGAIDITTRHTGDTVTFTNIATTAAGRIGDITIRATGDSDVSFGDLGASALGTITVIGSGNITFGSVSGVRVPAIDLAQLGSGGSFTVDLSAVSNAVTVSGGRGTMTVVSTDGSDEFNLLTGVGTDRIVQATAIANVFDTVYRFEAGTADDRVSFDISEFASGFLDTDGSGLAAADAIVFATANGAAVTLGTATIILFTTAYATTAALITDAKADITLQSAMASGEFIGVWTDGSNTYVSMINFEEETQTAATANAATWASASALTVTTMVMLDGVSPGALVAANFSVV